MVFELRRERFRSDLMIPMILHMPCKRAPPAFGVITFECRHDACRAGGRCDLEARDPVSSGWDIRGVFSLFRKCALDHPTTPLAQASRCKRFLSWRSSFARAK